MARSSFQCESKTFSTLSYELEFHEDAFDELNALDGSVRPMLAEKTECQIGEPKNPISEA
jgi:hypothetical protein